MAQTLAITASALKKIPPWNSWLAQSDGRLYSLLEKLSEKAVFAAEALEQAVSDADASQAGGALSRMAALQGDADRIIQEAFALLNHSRVMLLSREQTRALTRAIRGILDAAASSEQMLGSSGRMFDPDALALATALRRSVEQVRLAVSGLREASDWPETLRSCAHIRALQREGALLLGRIAPENGLCRALGAGLDRCGEAADVLENIMRPSKRPVND